MFEQPEQDAAQRSLGNFAGTGKKDSMESDEDFLSADSLPDPEAELNRGSGDNGDSVSGEEDSENGDVPETEKTPLPESLKHILFPHGKVRPIQDKLMEAIDGQLRKGAIGIFHAPTGLGKTAAALGPAVTLAIEKGLTVFFLTSRHTQHRVVLDTLKKIQKRHNVPLSAVSMIGKKWLCLQPNVEVLKGRDFYEYCRAMREDGKCEYYENLRLKSKDDLSVDAKAALGKMSNKIHSSEEIIETSKRHVLCPYEMSVLLAKKATVIVCDYQYMFNPMIRDGFLKKMGKELNQCIVVVDEAHNLPSRIKDLSSSFLTNFMIRRALTESKKFKFEDIEHILKEIEELLEGYALEFEQRRLGGNRGRQGQESYERDGNSGNANNDADDSELIDYNLKERYLRRETFLDALAEIADIDDLIEKLEKLADAVREEQKQSYLGTIAEFIAAWRGEDEGFTRIFSVKEGVKEKMLTLSYRCLDPSLSAGPLFSGCHSSVLMSGTLTPTGMYRELMGIKEAKEEAFKSPFPKENKLQLIIPKTSTKYAARSVEQYSSIAQVLNEVVTAIKGNSAVFFPSYYLRDAVYRYFKDICHRTVFSELPNMNKLEKHDFLENFKKYKKTGAVLFGVITGSFSEGIDLPGDELMGVVVVGLPLSKPDLETKALIKYYDGKFAKGWEYGYIAPAFTRTFQSAGRCIRTEKDRGVVVFLDERYSWPQYYKYFPPGEVKISLLYRQMIEGFFRQPDLP